MSGPVSVLGVVWTKYDELDIVRIAQYNGWVG